MDPCLGEWAIDDINPQKDIRMAMPSRRLDGFGIEQLATPVFPGVYSPGEQGHYETDHGYYRALINLLEPQVGEEALVVGPGVGLEVWALGLFTGNPVYAYALRYREAVNAALTASIGGIPAHVFVRDNIINSQGKPHLPKKLFDIIVWNMPGYSSGKDQRTMARDDWDGDPQGRAMKRLARGLRQVLKPEGRLLIWNWSSTVEDAKTKEKRDVVFEILRSEGSYDGRTGTRPKKPLINVQTFPHYPNVYLATFPENRL